MGGAARVELERDLLAQLLELRAASDPRAVLVAVLDKLVTVTGAERAYLEMLSTHDDVRPDWTLTHGCSASETSEIRAVTSRGIVASALAAGTTLHVPYATLDERFADQPSVREQRLEAVLCVPLSGIGAGVLYLEGRRGSGPFADADVRLAELVAKHVSPDLGRAQPTHRDDRDPTRPFRDRCRLDGVAGRSVALAKVFAQVEPYAPLDLPILITGATGTGKTQIARAIHDNSPRRNGPFHEVNCNAIPEGLIESELFGTMPGAFPGARRAPGKVEAAEGGTLFFDEVVEIPMQAQGKLLQLLQSRTYYSLGSTRIAHANVRILTATNADLAAMVAAKQFREDLFYRINVVDIRMPSLDERREDIPLLVDELLERAAEELRIRRVHASSQFRLVMKQRAWPGNVRELRNVVQRALVLANAEGANQVESRHLQPELPKQPSQTERAPTFHEATRLYQRELLKGELAAQGWNVAAVADRLEITRSHVYNLIHQFSLVRPEVP